MTLGLLLLIVSAGTGIGRAGEAKSEHRDSPMPAYRIEAEGFKASEADIRAVCDSAGRELWRHFSDYPIEPMVVTRGHNDPTVLFRRNDRGEIVMRLNTGGTYWCQYAYQFAHEFCHVLCGFDEDYQGNKWFEETLCETASLYAIRAMARAWEKDPPYPNWRDFRDSLRRYADNVIAQRSDVYEIYEKGLGGFYRAHQKELEANPCLRRLNGAMALVFLRLFEEEPSRWEAVRWLNAAPSKPGETFRAYLQNWHNAVPQRHKAFVEKVARLYSVDLGPGD